MNLMHLAGSAAVALILTAAGQTAETRTPSTRTVPPPNFAGEIARHLEPTRRVVYKTVDDRQLSLDIFDPEPARSGGPRSGFVVIHGGGWGAGNPRAMYPFTAWAAKIGIVGISVQYRLYQPGTAETVFECVKDARSAVRYVRAHAVELGLDARKIVVGGASAGGHLAAATALLAFDTAGENTGVSCRPDALVLFSPVIDTSPAGYGQAKIGARWRELSPVDQVRPGLPPTLIFHGTGDATTPFAGARRFHEAMQAAGNRSELVAEAGAQHTYMFKDASYYADTERRLAAFFASLGFLPGGR